MMSRMGKKTPICRPNKGEKKITSTSSPISQTRLLLVWSVFGVATLGLLGRLYQLQVVDQAKFKNLAVKQQTSQLKVYTPRRPIVDSRGNIIATDRLVYTLYAHPIMFLRQNQSRQSIAAKLADILPDLTEKEILAKLQTKNTGIPLARNLSESVAESINSLRVPSPQSATQLVKVEGLDLEKTYTRFYPHQKLFAEIIGYLDGERQPQAGVELSQDKLLRREAPKILLRRTGDKKWMPGDLPADKAKKTDAMRLQLTIDLRLQRTVRNVLQAQMQKYRAKRGAVIVMNVQDGSIAAMTSEPTYNPNEYYKYPINLFKNWAITDLYEPGSTFKPINIAIALDAGVINGKEIINDPGKIKIGGWDIFNHNYHSSGANGQVSITRILEVSSNIGMIKVMSRLQPLEYYQKLQELGLTEPMDTDLPGYTPGYLKRQAEFVNTEIEPATTAFGQGFSLTPLKLVQLHSAIANGGKLVTPHVIKGLADAEGYIHWRPRFIEKQVFSPTTSQKVLKMMESVVKNGSGKLAQIPGYSIAGKTGTAQKAKARGGYLPNAKITSFIASFPVESPRYTILAVVDEPQGGNTFGSTVAAPIVKSVIEAIIALEGIPPKIESKEAVKSP